MRLFTNTWQLVRPDALQEFNVQAHITDAQFAISSGRISISVTRSGTKNFHGSGWEFARNSVFDGRNFFDTNRLPYSQNQYGVYLGGPILFPHFTGETIAGFPFIGKVSGHPKAWEVSQVPLLQVCKMVIFLLSFHPRNSAQTAPWAARIPE